MTDNTINGLEKATGPEEVENDGGRAQMWAQQEAELFHEVMDCLRKMKMKHGLCEPRSRRACSHCNGRDRLDEIVAAYKGPRVVLA